MILGKSYRSSIKNYFKMNFRIKKIWFISFLLMVLINLLI